MRTLTSLAIGRVSAEKEPDFVKELVDRYVSLNASIAQQYGAHKLDAALHATASTPGIMG